MRKKTLADLAQEAYADGKRLVVPLMGFPGLNITNTNIKLAQQNYGEHYRVIKSLADRFSPDLIFPLMDLSVEANALGRYTMFPKDDSATVVRDVFDMAMLDRWENINIALDTRLRGYVETVQLMDIGLPEHIKRGAYVAGPYSLAALIMGADDAAMATVLEPEKLHILCDFSTERIQTYVRQLISAGAEVICVLEPSAVMLGPDQFEEFSSNYIRHIANSCIYNDVDIIYHTCGNTMHLVEKMVGANVHGVSLDSSEAGVNLLKVAKLVPKHVAVIGNISPTTTILNGTPDRVRTEVVELLEAMDPYPNYILSTGCDLPQETPLENIQAFMDAGREYRIGSQGKSI